MDQLTDEERAKIREIVESWESAQAGVRVVIGIGNVVKWLAAVATGIGVLWAVFHDKANAAVNHMLHRM